MGGNQALRDCVDILPPLLHLNEASKSGNSPSTVEVKKALALYESKMIDRAFAWVQKSGGVSMPVRSIPDSIQSSKSVKLLNQISTSQEFDFDGYLGTTIHLLSLFLLPIWRLAYYLKLKLWG